MFRSTSPWLHETNEPLLAKASGGFVFMVAMQACLNLKKSLVGAD